VRAPPHFNANAADQLKQHLLASAVALKPGKRQGGDAWFPFYAGYSSDFVRESLNGLCVKPGSRVVDPWNGAGTTTTVADSFGCYATGFDINPVATLVASARLTCPSDVIHSVGLASELLAVADRIKIRASEEDPLRAWFTPRLAHRFRSIWQAITGLLASKNGEGVNPADAPPPPFAAFFFLCLMRAGKGLVRIKDSSNPTWITPEVVVDAAPSILDRSFLTMVRTSVSDSESFWSKELPVRKCASSIQLADSRSVPLSGNSTDLIITSPPYCTRIDYFRATSYELAALGIGPKSNRMQDLRLAAMGTNLMRPESRSSSTKTLPRSVVLILNRIKLHQSKSSDSYYYRSYLQYFLDAQRSLLEMKRILRQGGCGVLVVQTSYYKNIHVPLGDLYRDIALHLGFCSDVAYRVQVRRTLTTINSRASAHQSSRFYSEDVVVLQKK
jgi:hypothetical protein